MRSRREQLYNAFPEPVAGYELSPEKSYFSIIIPEATQNLIINPSAEIASTGYLNDLSTITRVLTYSKRGAASIQVAPNANVAAGVYREISLTSGVTYTFSADVLDIVGQTFNMFFFDGVSAIYNNISWRGNRPLASGAYHFYS